MPQLGGLNPSFACEASFCKLLLVEVTRMPIYTNTLGSVPTQYFLLSKYFSPSLFSFFFLSCHSIFFPPPFLLFSLTSPFFFLFSFFPFFFSPFFLPIFSLRFAPPFLFSFLFLCLLLLGMSDQPFEMSDHL